MAAQNTLPARTLPTELPSTARLFVFPVAEPARMVALKGEATIGRADTNTIALRDARASSAHLRLRKRRDTREWELEDLGSTNGSFVNGAPVTTHPLATGDVIRVGDSLAVFERGQRPSGAMAHRSVASLELDSALDRVAGSDAPVLVLGPTGAGKGHLAQQIADRTPRTGRVVHVNCAALPANLVEAELFGHVKGAFTGATAAKPGLIEEADKGTLFLDEIGTLPNELQAKLLVAVEEGKVRRVGSTTDRTVDVRYVAATNLNVRQAIDAGTFREDLYYRLAAHTVVVPGLAQRRPDILPLFLHAADLDDHTRVSPEFNEALLLWRWPGNVRELINVARTLRRTADAHDYDALPAEMTTFLRERALAMSQSGPAQAAAVPRLGSAPTREELIALLDAHDGNVSAIARALDKHRNQVVRWLDAYGLRNG